MKARSATDAILDALAVACELTGTELTPAAIRAMLTDLSGYAPDQVLAALARCRRELKGRLTLAAIIDRLDDGRPGPQEAWAMIPTDEQDSVVWTDEMAEAYGLAAPLLADGDRIAARMAFLEAYQAAVHRARAERRPPRWFPSLGMDPRGRCSGCPTAMRTSSC
jgi:hypothetical protein